jgi:hypothetical protein
MKVGVLTLLCSLAQSFAAVYDYRQGSGKWGQDAPMGVPGGLSDFVFCL